MGNGRARLARGSDRRCKVRHVLRPARIAALLTLLGALVAAPASFAQVPNGKGTDRFVTLVARECPAYTDITANRARNDIQESLRDLGADTAL